MDKPLRILLIEDQVPDAELLERELQRDGLEYSLQRVATRESFQQSLKTFSPHVILSDSNVPGFGGLEALELAKRLAPGIPFIFVSGQTHEDRKTVALQRGAADFVDKDRQERIASAITRALEAKKRGA
jgi:phosphoserine phosphatase RsbU/P